MTEKEFMRIIALMPWSDSLPDFCKKKYSQVESVTIPEMSLCKAKV